MAANTAHLRQIAKQEARKYGVKPGVFLRQINLESGFNPKVTSSAGAQGIAQFMPGTAKSEGVNPWNPRSALEGAARLDAKLIKQTGSYRKALAAYNAGPGNIPAGLGYADKILAGRAPSASSARPRGGGAATRTIPGRDRSGERRSLLLNYLLGNSGGDLLDTVTQISQLKDTAPKTVKVKGSSSTGGGKVSTKGGVTMIDGKPVANWIAKRLERAKKAGWTGTVSSGYRSVAEQRRIYNSGVRPAAKPGQSNHNFTAFPGGAVDVTDAPQLAATLKKLGIKKLKWAGGKDPVHFSHPRNGTY